MKLTDFAVPADGTFAHFFGRDGKGHRGDQRKDHQQRRIPVHVDLANYKTERTFETQNAKVFIPGERET